MKLSFIDTQMVVLEEKRLEDKTVLHNADYAYRSKRFSKNCFQEFVNSVNTYCNS